MTYFMKRAYLPRSKFILHVTMFASTFKLTFAFHHFMFSPPSHTNLVSLEMRQISNAVFLEEFVIVSLGQLHVPRLRCISQVFTVPQEAMILLKNPIT